MSRSYKKTPIVKDGNKSKKFAKKCANKKVRTFINENKDEVMPQNRSYVKLYCQYEIADYCSRWSKEEAIQDYYECKDSCHKTRWRNVRDISLNEWLYDYWYKWYKRK